MCVELDELSDGSVRKPLACLCDGDDDGFGVIKMILTHQKHHRTTTLLHTFFGSLFRKVFLKSLKTLKVVIEKKGSMNVLLLT